ncbi:copper resistance protein B [Sphingomonas montanisoli]|uniref:Copper resistance protein B n=1 Tax=Sphingomonas montanisoli TaxID=2606412 RepID=A0A5D9CC83_9SPHN|nr:copper resistance protein B [Sphingomonas montanisoli]TZG29578.1 copper resistance protein B [Sphingomonas montanisoli]
MMRLACLALVALASPAVAQDHSHHMPPPAAQPATGHEGLDMGSMGDMDMSAGHEGHDMSPGEPTGTNLPAGNAPAPAAPMDHYADRQFAPAAMAEARHMMMREGGGQTMALIMFNIAEVQARKGSDGYRWDGEGWFGGDINRLTIKTEGEGARRGGVEAAEIQALYSRAIGPYFNLQAGIRHDFRPDPSRTYAVVGVEGLAPYWFEVEAAAFLSDKGDVLGRFEAYYDQRLTQRLVLQPRVELNLAAQDVSENRIGAGLSSAELGLRLRYEITRQFAPYVGVSHEAKVGQTARYARADGDDPKSTGFVAGIRIWF